MLLDILIPSNGNISKLQKIMEGLSQQTLEPDRVLILIHKTLEKEEQELLLYFLQRASSQSLGQKIFLITNLTAEYTPGKGVGCDRNELFSYAQAKFVYMIDHDNEFAATFLEDTAALWHTLYEEFGKPLIVSPTVMYKHTGDIQSQGITGFSFLIPKMRYGKIDTPHPQPLSLLFRGRSTGRGWQRCKMIGANSLFGLRETFAQFPFDPRFARCMEDVDMTYRMSQAGVPVICLDKVEIYHMEKQKSPLEKVFLGSPASAFERSRNRIWFVKKNANLWQKIQYFGIGLWLQTVWFFFQILRHGGDQRKELWRAVIDGTSEGIEG